MKRNTFNSAAWTGVHPGADIRRPKQKGDDHGERRVPEAEVRGHSAHVPSPETLQRAEKVAKAHFAADDAKGPHQRAGERAGVEIGETIGWRFWRVPIYNRPMLWSLAVDVRWYPGEPMTLGKCYGGGEKAGARNGFDFFGVHAFHSEECARRDVFDGYFGNQFAVAFGRVALWGRIIDCDRGYRAEFAYPLSFEMAWGPGTYIVTRAMSYEGRRLCDFLSDTYLNNDTRAVLARVDGGG